MYLYDPEPELEPEPEPEQYSDKMSEPEPSSNFPIPQPWEKIILLPRSGSGLDSADKFNADPDPKQRPGYSSVLSGKKKL
jgi:hypothetical protein